MFNVGFPELIVIFIVALVVVGPEKLPELARVIAGWVIEFRRAMEEVKRELTLDEIEEAHNEIGELKKEVSELKPHKVLKEPESTSTEKKA